MGEAVLKPAALALAMLLLAAGAGAGQPPAVSEEPELPTIDISPPSTVGAPPLEDPAELLPGEAPPEAGPVVTGIEIRADAAPDDKEDLTRLLSFELGEVLTDESVRSTLRNLQASGFASSVELYTLPGDTAPGDRAGTVTAVVVLRPVVRVREVRLEGELGLPAGELRRVLPQGEAVPLSEERVVQGVYRLLDHYNERGYFDAEVRVGVETDDRTHRAVVTYNVDSGDRARVEAVQFEGELGPFAAATLVNELDVKPGDPYSLPEVREDAERLETWLVQQGYRTARVGEPAVETADAGVRLLYPLDVGPRVVVEIVGGDRQRLRRRGLLPFLGSEGYDEALVLQAAERIERDYQEDGYYKVQVDWDEERTDELLRVTIRIEPGPRYTLQQVAFTGNDTFRSEQLRDLIATAPRSLLALGSGHLVEDVLDEDLENLERFYELQGFGLVEVGPPLVEERGRDLFVTIPIEEGPRRRVVDLEVRGIEALDEGAVAASLALEEGGPFHPFLLERSLNNLRVAYRDRGYSMAQVSAQQDWNEARTLVDITIEALEGVQTVLDRVIVRGNRRTESEVIRRTLAVERGDPISERRALEIERDLYRMGIFSSVDVELTRAGLESATRDLVVRLEEAPPRRVSYGAGIEYQDDESAEQRWNPLASFSFSHNNVAGRAYTLRTDLRVSTLSNIARVRFEQPYTGRWAVPLSYSLFYFEERKDRWDVQRHGARIEAVKLFDDRRTSLAYDYRIVDTDLEAGFPLEDVERQDRPYEISSLIPSFFWDRRNDPIQATRGWSSLAQVEWAFPAFDTEGDFLKVFLQQTQYLDLGRVGTLAASLRGGGIEPFSELPRRDPEVPEPLPSAEIFIDERFFAGGGTTHRAYGRDDLGIVGRTLLPEAGGDPGELTAVGGAGLLLLNLEYRFPLFGPVGGTVFYDAGNVWADWQEIDVGEVKQGAGVGVRYLSPIGPLRLDIGWKLDREPQDDRAYAVSLTFGNPF